MFPVVLATPASLSKWLPPYKDPIQNTLVAPKWQVAVVDDSTALPWYIVSTLVPRACTIVLSGGSCDFFAKSSSNAKQRLVEIREQSEKCVDGDLIAYLSIESSFNVAKTYSNNVRLSELCCSLKGSYVSPQEASKEITKRSNKKKNDETNERRSAGTTAPSLPLACTVSSVLKSKSGDEPPIALTSSSSKRNRRNDDKKKGETSQHSNKQLPHDGNDDGAVGSGVAVGDSPRVRVVCGSKWNESRIGSRLDNSLDCLSRVLTLVPRYDRSPGLMKACKKILSDRTAIMGAAYEAVRKLRCAWVNEGEAAAVVAEAWNTQVLFFILLCCFLNLFDWGVMCMWSYMFYVLPLCVLCCFCSLISKNINKW
jgi:hypothetical protein